MFRLKYRFFFVILILFFFSDVNSQNINLDGFIYNKKDNSLIPYANISVINTSIGTVSNSEGYFSLSLNSDEYEILISHIGFEDIIISANKSISNYEIKLNAIAYEMEEIIVDPYTWAERYLLNAIIINETQKEQLKFYEAKAYSKTSFKSSKKELFAIIEAISELSYLALNKYKEKLTAIRKQKHIKNLPYEPIAVNQSLNLLNSNSSILQFAFKNPLNPAALNFYDVSLIKKMVSKNDTLVYLKLEPKSKNEPLFGGELVFNNNHLVEALLTGNIAASNASYDSLKLNQKFGLVENKFNIPTFTEYSYRWNLGIMEVFVNQQYVYNEYLINNPNRIPFITANTVLEKDIRGDYDIEFSRDNLFKIPLTKEEKKHKEKINRIFDDGSIVKKGIMFLFLDLFPLVFDYPSDFLGLKINNFSNIYRFNKIDGHYLGYDNYFFNARKSLLFGKIGYGFSSEQIYFTSIYRHNNFEISLKKELKDLGGFNTEKTFQTVNALIYHSDNFHYYNSYNTKAQFILPLFTNIEVILSANIEKQKVAKNNSSFSFFQRDKKYLENIDISEYWNNNFSLTLDFKMNNNYLENKLRILKGESFINFTGNVNFWNKKVGSTENLFSYELKLRSYLEIYGSIKIDLGVNYYKIKNSIYIQQNRFTSKYRSTNNQEIPLTFATLEDYEYTLNNYLHVETHLNLFDLPQIYKFRTSLGVFFTALKSFENTNNFLKKTLSSKVFQEFGVVLKGVSFLNFYLCMNNLNSDKVFLKIDLEL